MAKSKDFDEFYGKLLFDEDPGKKKFKFSKLGVNGVHPDPIEAVVLDKNQNVLSGGEAKIKHNNKKHHEKGRKSREDGRESKKGDRRDSNDSGSSYNFGDITSRSVVSRTGITLAFSGDSTELQEIDPGGEHAKDESDEELANVCVDRMSLSTTRTERRRRRLMELLSDSPVSLYNSTESPMSIGSSHRGSSSSRSSHDFPSSATFYQESLEKLYEYAGVILEDRYALKERLAFRKAVVLEQYYQFMEDLITNILKLKEMLLHEVEEFHQANTRTVSKETTKFTRIRYECRQVVQSLKEAEESRNIEKFRESVTVAVQRADVFETILKRFHDSLSNCLYLIEPSKEINAAFQIRKVAHVEMTIDTPTLPPFLTSNSENSQSENGSNKTEFIHCTEGDDSKTHTKCAFSGITYVSKENILVTDWTNGFVKLFNKYGVIADKMDFEESPWDVVSVCEGRVAVTVPKLRAVYFLECDPHLHVTGYFSTDCECFGIDKSGDNYVITCDPWSNFPSVRIFTDSGQVLKVLDITPSGRNLFKCPLHVCVDYFNTAIFVSDSSADCVHVISHKGSLLCTYEHGLLEYPTGLAVDRNNSIYVCCKTYSNIHVIDGQGTYQRIDLRAKDGLHSPRAICFHPYGDVMVVTDLEVSNSNGFLKRYLT